nr:pro Pol polyprotein [Hymenolepis microstoma]
MMTSEAESAFSVVKQELSKATTSNHPETSSGTSLVLKTDASQMAVGAVLQQMVKGEAQPLSFFSEKLTTTETRYSTFGHNLFSSRDRSSRKRIGGRSSTISMICRTQALITDRFVWKNIQQDVRQWAKNCLSCQASKVHRHTRSPLACFPLPEVRFRHINVDIVSPLSPSNSFSYVLTCIDRFMRWPVAVPLHDTSSASVAKALIESWISIFGASYVITTDRGSQFTSTLFRKLHHSTPY